MAAVIAEVYDRQETSCPEAFLAFLKRRLSYYESYTRLYKGNGVCFADVDTAGKWVTMQCDLATSLLARPA